MQAPERRWSFQSPPKNKVVMARCARWQSILRVLWQEISWKVSSNLSLCASLLRVYVALARWRSERSNAGSYAMLGLRLSVGCRRQGLIFSENLLRVLMSLWEQRCILVGERRLCILICRLLCSGTCLGFLSFPSRSDSIALAFQ